MSKGHVRTESDQVFEKMVEKLEIFIEPLLGPTATQEGAEQQEETYEDVIKSTREKVPTVAELVTQTLSAISYLCTQKSTPPTLIEMAIIDQIMSRTVTDFMELLYMMQIRAAGLQDNSSICV
jgi:hypothetical protein